MLLSSYSIRNVWIIPKLPALYAGDNFVDVHFVCFTLRLRHTTIAPCAGAHRHALDVQTLLYFRGDRSTLTGHLLFPLGVDCLTLGRPRALVNLHEVLIDRRLARRFRFSEQSGQVLCIQGVAQTLNHILDMINNLPYFGGVEFGRFRLCVPVQRRSEFRFVDVKGNLLKALLGNLPLYPFVESTTCGCQDCLNGPLRVVSFVLKRQ